MGPLIYINAPAKYMLAYGLQQFLSAYGGQWTQLMAPRNRNDRRKN